MVLVDVLYARGWDDCLEAVVTILNNSKKIREAKKRVEELQVLVKSKKFERIKDELGFYESPF